MYMTSGQSDQRNTGSPEHVLNSRYSQNTVGQPGMPVYSRHPAEAGPHPPPQHSIDGRGQAAPFFPTPAQAIEYQQYAGIPRQGRHHQSSSSSMPMSGGYPHPSARTAAPFPPSVPPAQHYPVQIAETTPNQSGMSPNPNSPLSGERFSCVKCGATFGRSHDRKRHFETHHLATPPVHRCQYCKKEFSRADSLKRHVDNGCEAMGQ